MHRIWGESVRTHALTRDHATEDPKEHGILVGLFGGT
jgi:hypothetical protein